MANRITEKEQAAKVSAEASVLITQPETVDGESVEVLRRATLEKLISVLNELGVGGLAFDEIAFDHETGYLHVREEGQDVVEPAHITNLRGPGLKAVHIDEITDETGNGFEIRMEWDEDDFGNTGGSYRVYHGKTPVKGVDYWTEDDQAAIVDQIVGDVTQDTVDPASDAPVSGKAVAAYAQPKITIDSSVNSSSNNPVSGKAVAAYAQPKMTIDSSVNSSSNNPVSGKAVSDYAVAKSAVASTVTASGTNPVSGAAVAAYVTAQLAAIADYDTEVF